MVFESKGISALRPNVWKESVTFTELSDTVRSKGDSQFTELCHRLTIGNKGLGSEILGEIPVH